jgi:hypothetical protein
MTDNTVNTDPEYIYNFDNFFAISADFICIAGFDGYFKRINPAVSEVLGFGRELLYQLVVLYTHQIQSNYRNKFTKQSIKF